MSKKAIPLSLVVQSWVMKKLTMKSALKHLFYCCDEHKVFILFKIQPISHFEKLVYMTVIVNCTPVYVDNYNSLYGVFIRTSAHGQLLLQRNKSSPLGRKRPIPELLCIYYTNNNVELTTRFQLPIETIASLYFKIYTGYKSVYISYIS